MPMRRVMVAVLVSLALSSGPAAARTFDQPPAYIKKEGSFVVYPSRAVGVAGIVFGGLIALPAALISTPIGFAAGDPLGYALIPSSLVGTGFGEVGYHVGGAIPFALKKTFYDGPMLAVARIKGDPASGLVAQVDPPPAVSLADIQYLESTPSEARVLVVPPREYSVALPPPRQPTSLMLKRQLSPFKLPPGTPVVAPAAATSSASLSRRSPVAPAVAPVAPAAAEPVTAAPAPVEPAPVESAAVQDIGVPPVPVTAPPPAAAPEPAAAEPAEEVERPSLKKKKRKFSERFGF